MLNNEQRTVIPPTMSNIVEFPALSFTCPQLWACMKGDEKTRFCEVCQKNVHNLSMMSSEERQALLSSTGESPCVAYFKHVNGEPADVTALADENPLKEKLKKTALLSLCAAGAGSIAVSSMALMEEISKNQQVPTTGTCSTTMVVGMICPSPEDRKIIEEKARRLEASGVSVFPGGYPSVPGGISPPAGGLPRSPFFEQ